MVPAEIFRNWPEWLEHPEIGRNLTRGGTGYTEVPVCMPVRNIPAVPAETEWNQKQ